MNNFFRRMSQLGLPPLTMRRMWVCYRHAWPAAINRCQSLAAIYQWCDPRQSSTYIYILISLSYVPTCTNFRAIIVPSIPIITSTYRFSFCLVFYTCSVHLDFDIHIYLLFYILGLSLVYWAIITLVF